MSSRSIALSGNKRLLADLSLLVVAVVWGSAFAVQRIAAAHLGPFLYNGLRFLLGALTLLPMLWGRWQRPSRAEWLGGSLAGALLVAASALQQAGLQFTTAGKAGFITGLYVVLVPLFLALGWRQRLHRHAWIASLVAVAGLFLLSVERSPRPSPGALNAGDGLELAGAVLWALHVILIGLLAARVDALRLALVQYVVCGLFSTALGLGLEGHTLSGMRQAWWTVVYGGLLSVGVGFTLQVIGQKVAPPTDAAVILSLETVFAAFFGWLLLGETLSARQIVGCALMFAGMLIAQRGAQAPGA
jgi:drug/metabolite transporter (DMT)-like permease